MAFDRTNEHNAMLDTDEFAVDAVFSRSGLTVAVIFDDDYQDPMGIEASGPMAQGKASDFTGVIHGDTLTISSVVYKITNTQPDGNGWITLRLRKTT